MSESEIKRVEGMKAGDQKDFATLKPLGFDPIKDIGRPIYFDVDKFLDIVEAMISADEVLRALWMLDNLPAYYRIHCNCPPRAKKIRDRLHKQLFTPIQYAKCLNGEPIEFLAEMQMPSRGELLDRLIKELNDANVVPTVSELAPGDLWLEGIMRARGRQFKYEFMALNDEAILAKSDEPSYNIFVAFELIEHLYNPIEIYQNYLKFGREAHVVFMSTPYCTFGGGIDRWYERELGHLRAYTPDEFIYEGSKMFANFQWQIHHDSVMTLIGRKAT